MSFGLLRLVLDPIDDDSEIILDENPLCMKYLPGIYNTYSGSFKLSFHNRKFKKTRVPGRQKPTIKIPIIIYPAPSLTSLTLSSKFIFIKYERGDNNYIL